MQIKIINRSNNELPAYETAFAAGMDLRANLNSTLVIKPRERALIETGLYMEIEPGYEVQIRPRSGLAFKQGITVLNAPGTVDADYRGEIKVLLINHGHENVEINHGDRIAQMVLAKHERIEWVNVEKLTETTRGAGGYGSTGKQ
ncbi:MAG: dUTP diphosphatase [Bacteroidetes bacterium]|nr:MAG: dUTP diphosphatase [Bacteroidota bacterium]